MIWFGKIIGILVGVILFGPLGALIGLFIGHRLDVYFSQISQKPHWVAQEVFFNTTFKIMGYIAKIDGRVSEQSIKAARNTMHRLGLSQHQKLRAIELFNLGKDGNILLESELLHLCQVCHNQRSLLRIFFEIQWQIASADGYPSPRKEAILRQICKNLGISFPFSGFNSRQHSHKQTRYQPNVFPLDKDYALLNISRNVSNAEVKKAYRKMMSQNHPDKLVAKGLPEAVIKLATEKTQQIQSAYERIMASRGK